MNAVALATLQAAHASAMVLVCAEVRDNSANPDDRALAREALYDAKYALVQARETLIDLGADQGKAVAAILGLGGS